MDERSKMTNEEFRRIQDELDVTNWRLGLLLNQAERSVENWRGSTKVPGAVARLMTLMGKDPEFFGTMLKEYGRK